MSHFVAMSPLIFIQLLVINWFLGNPIRMAWEYMTTCSSDIFFRIIIIIVTIAFCLHLLK